MKYINLNYKAPTKSSNLIIAFKGWPDAGEAATSTLNYLCKEKNGKLLATIDPEEFFDFIRIRPQIHKINDNNREIIWPENEFFYFPDDTSQDTGNMILLGMEPSLKWKTFCKLIIDLAMDNGVKRVIFVGSLLDGVPHSRTPLLSGFATNDSLNTLLHEKGIYPSNYEGPTGISSAIMEACLKYNLEYVSIWGHVPHYLEASPNYRVSFSLIEMLISLFDLSVGINKMNELAFDFDLQIKDVVSESEEMKNYVKKLEKEYDQKSIFDDINSPSLDLVQDLEEFLRKRKE